LQGFVGGAVDHFQAHGGQWVPLARAEVFSVQSVELLPVLRGIALNHDVKDRVRGIIRVALFAAEQRAVDTFLGGSGEAARAVSRQRWFYLARLRLCAIGGLGNELVQLGQEGLPTRLELDLLEVAHAIEHAVGEGLLVGKRAQHAVFDGLL
jgi:hypothetical protein